MLYILIILIALVPFITNNKRTMLLGFFLVLPTVGNLLPFKLGLGSGFSVKNLLIILILIAGLISNKSKEPKIQKYSIEIIWLAFCFFTFISIAYNYNPNTFISISESIKGILDIIITIIIIRLLRLSAHDTSWIAKRFFISLSFMTLISFLLYFLNINVTATQTFNIIDNRMLGIFGEPNYTGAYLASTLPIGIFYWAYTKGLKKNLLGILIIIYCIGIIYTGSRAGIIGGMLSIIFTWYTYTKVNKKKIRLQYLVFISAALLALVLSVYYTIPADTLLQVQNRFVMDSNTSSLDQYSAGRLSVYSRGLTSILQDPLLGKGYLGFMKWHHLHYGWPIGIHNAPLDIFSNFGVFPFLIYLLLFIKLFKYSYHTVKEEPFFLVFFITLFFTTQSIPFVKPHILAAFSALVYNYYLRSPNYPSISQRHNV